MPICVQKSKFCRKFVVRRGRGMREYRMGVVLKEKRTGNIIDLAKKDNSKYRSNPAFRTSIFFGAPLAEVCTFR